MENWAFTATIARAGITDQILGANSATATDGGSRLW